MNTPVGEFHADLVVEVAEAQLFNGGIWEGAARLRKEPNRAGGWPFVLRNHVGAS
jgi:hypothetical protein